VLKTHLCVYYRHHVLVTDQVCDAPTVRILRHILLEEEEHVKWGQAIYEELAHTPERRRQAIEWQQHLELLLAESGGVTGGR
jgi:bacterioferritin (cytochrome b1)